MRILLDTNVFISGVFFGGLPYQILKSWRDGRVRLVLSPEILDEYQRVGEHLAEQFPGVDVDPILELLTLQAELISAAKMPEPVCVDPDDDKFLPCALTAKIKLIISGDKHLLKISGYRGIQVMQPRKFVDDHLR